MKKLFEMFGKGLPVFSVYEVYDKAQGRTVGVFSTERLAYQYIELANIKLFDVNEIKVNNKMYYERFVK